MNPIPPNFSFIARPYRFLEHLALGRALERTRLHFLSAVSHQAQALVLGDGDGRFLARLLTRLRTTRLPDHTAAFTKAGLTRIDQHHRLGGLLTTELWQLA